jgi:hypothetical protein
VIRKELDCVKEDYFVVRVDLGVVMKRLKCDKEEK